MNGPGEVLSCQEPVRAAAKVALRAPSDPRYKAAREKQS